VIAGRLVRSRADVRRSLGWSLVAGLSIAALTAAVAVVEGSFDDADWRVIGTSLGFAVFSATGAAGASLRLRRPGERSQLLGAAALVAALAAFAFLVVALWIDREGDAIWHWWGVATLIALGTSHAALVIAARSAADAPVVDFLVRVSLACGAVDTSIAVLLVAGTIDEGPAEGFALLVIALVLSTALTPIVRRLVVAPAATADPVARGSRDVGAELLEIASRVEALAGLDRARATELRRHADGLRASARQR